MAYQLTQQIQVLNKHSNIDLLYGPYVSKEQACAAIPEAIRDYGKTVLIGSNSYYAEYWWKDKLTDNGLIPKITTNGGSSESVQSDWNETNEISPAYIQNKPKIPKEFTIKEKSMILSVGSLDFEYNIIDDVDEGDIIIWKNNKATYKINPDIKDDSKAISDCDLLLDHLYRICAIEYDNVLYQYIVHLTGPSQSDYNQTDENSSDFIKNKPDLTNWNLTIYESVTQACTYIPKSQRKLGRTILIGKNVGTKEEPEYINVQEFWWGNGIEDADLIVKTDLIILDDTNIIATMADYESINLNIEVGQKFIWKGSYKYWDDGTPHSLVTNGIYICFYNETEDYNDYKLIFCLTTPYINSLAVVGNVIPKEVRYIGMTVNVAGEEYYFKDDIENNNLVLKYSNEETIKILNDNAFIRLENGLCELSIEDNIYFIYKGNEKKYINNKDLNNIQICIPNVLYFYKDNKLNRLGELLNNIYNLTANVKGVLNCLYKLNFTSTNGSILTSIKNIEALKNGDVIYYSCKYTFSNGGQLIIPSEINATIDIEINREKTINLFNISGIDSLTLALNDEVFIEFLYLDNYLYITKILKYHYGS